MIGIQPPIRIVITNLAVGILIVTGGNVGVPHKQGAGGVHVIVGSERHFDGVEEHGNLVTRLPENGAVAVEDGFGILPVGKRGLNNYLAVIFRRSG